MGIKFKNKVSPGVIAGGDVKEREIVFDLKNNSLYSSNDGIDIVKLGGGTEQGGIAYLPANDATYAVGDVVTHLGNAYVITTVPTTGDPATMPGQYTRIGTPEQGGIAFNPTTVYVTGDVVVEAGIAYFSTAGSTAHVFAPGEWTRIGTPEVGGIAVDLLTQYAIGDIVVEGDIAYMANVAPIVGEIPSTTPAKWTRIGTPEVGGITWDPAVQYSEGDIVTDAAGDVWVIDATPPAIGTSPTALDSTKLNVAERGGVLHTTVGQAYSVGDMVNLNGSNFIYVCKTAHTSTVDCNLAPDDINWYQPPVPAVPILEYNYTSDLFGTVSPVLPPGGHVPLPGVPDENGPHYFTVELGSAGLTAEVYVDGFKLRPSEYTTALDGYVEIFSAVSDNSWVQITI